jgi:hypothetical protein
MSEGEFNKSVIRKVVEYTEMRIFIKISFMEEGKQDDIANRRFAVTIRSINIGDAGIKVYKIEVIVTITKNIFKLKGDEIPAIGVNRSLIIIKKRIDIGM